MHLTYQYKLLPTRRQHEALERILEAERLLYNAALEERISCWKHGKALAGKRGADRPDPRIDAWKPVTYVDQFKSLTQIRRDDPDGFGRVPANLSRHTLDRVNLAFQGFFRRLKERRGRAGFPRFRSRSRWDSFGFKEFSGIRLEGGRLRFKGLPGGLRVHMHRPLPENAEIRACTFRKTVFGWTVSLRIVVPDAAPWKTIPGRALAWTSAFFAP